MDWKTQHDAAVRRQDAALREYRAASKDRGAALARGVQQLGSQAAVARSLGVSRAVVNRAIRALAKRADI